MANLAPLPAAKALDAYFLEARCKILEVAAILDRISRGAQVAPLAADPRLDRIRQALGVLHDQSGGRAERIQQVFSLDYDPAWEKPNRGSALGTLLASGAKVVDNEHV
jgi:hypothetical protein